MVAGQTCLRGPGVGFAFADQRFFRRVLARFAARGGGAFDCRNSSIRAGLMDGEGN
jgi:hypothetical protein